MAEMKEISNFHALARHSALGIGVWWPSADLGVFAAIVRLLIRETRVARPIMV